MPRADTEKTAVARVRELKLETHNDAATGRWVIAGKYRGQFRIAMGDSVAEALAVLEAPPPEAA